MGGMATRSVQLLKQSGPAAAVRDTYASFRMALPRIKAQKPIIAVPATAFHKLITTRRCLWSLGIWGRCSIGDVARTSNAPGRGMGFVKTEF